MLQMLVAMSHVGPASYLHAMLSTAIERAPNQEKIQHSRLYATKCIKIVRKHGTQLSFSHYMLLRVVVA